jgi:ubiquinone/menaquinone biosynthesis C-methylase UbiE
VSSGSISFDRAADYYDRTRSLSPAAEAATVAVLVPEIRRAGGPCVEVGVGTGRIALPLARAGVAVAGLDISRPMLEKLRQKAAGARVPVLVGDALAAPIRTDAAGAVVIAHVLHLVRDWKSVLSEVRRMVRPRGVALINAGAVDEQRRELERRFLHEAGVEHAHVGLDHDVALLDTAMEELGATVRTLEPFDAGDAVPLAWLLHAYGEGLFSFTWQIPDEVRRRASASVRSWAEERFGDLQERRSVPSVVTWRAYDLG